MVIGHSAPLQRQLSDTLFASLTGRQFQVLREVFPKLVDDGDRAVALAELQIKNAAPFGTKASCAAYLYDSQVYDTPVNRTHDG